MNAEIRDALPDLIHGRLSTLDRTTLTAHVESCSACSAELALLREISNAAPLAPAIDIGHVVAALPVPAVGHALLLQSANEVARNGGTRKPASGGFPNRRAIWGIAAALVVVAGGFSVVMGNRDGDAKNQSVAQAPGVIGTGGTGTFAPSGDASVARAPDGASSLPETVTGATVPAPAADAKRVAGASREAALTLVGGLNELSDAHIERLLSEMDEMEGIPSPEPESVTLALENLEGEE